MIRSAWSGKRIYTLGPIIHNEQVVGDLEEKGVEVHLFRRIARRSGTLLLDPLHGVGKNVYEI